MGLNLPYLPAAVTDVWAVDPMENGRPLLRFVESFALDD